MNLTLEEGPLGIRAALFILAAGIVLQQFDSRGAVYSDFNSTNGLILKEFAKVVDGRLRVAPVVPPCCCLGGAWLDAKQHVKDGFDTTFQIQITSKHSSGADGMAFVLQANAEPLVGMSGQGLGYQGISNQCVVHFDDYHWAQYPEGGRYDEVAILAATSPDIPLTNCPGNTLASVNRNINFSDGAVHAVRIVYEPGQLQVFLDDMATPILTASVDLAALLNLEDGEAWVGFTGSGGADWQNHDVISWKFSTGASTLGDGGSTHSQTAGSAVVAPTLVSSTPTGTAPVYVAASMPTALPRDPVFGYALPADVGLTHWIEASTDLKEWTTVTNVTLFFRDLDSTNYPERFYRFRRD